jgi:hypothetical protein
MEGRERHSIVVSLACFAFALGCESRPVPTDAGPSEPSPNASILPAPLATGPETHPTTDAGVLDAGPDADIAPPSSAREDVALPADLEELRDPVGLNLRARFRWVDVALPGRLPEMNTETLERARSASTFDLDVTVATAGRLRVAVASPRFVLAERSEFRSRIERFGSILLWPDGGRYVVVQPGALRGVFNERRADVIPLAHVSGSPRAVGPAFGFTVERTHLTSSLGKLDLDQAHAAAAGSGGALLCRFLVELAAVHPDSGACRSDLMPLRAEYAWTEGGGIVFEVTAVDRTNALEPDTLRSPPERASHRIGELPAPPTAQLVDRAQLRGFRIRPSVGRPGKDAPKDGLLLVNGDDVFRYALVDGVPVARLEPHGSGLLLDFIPGTYTLAARTFLGDEVAPLQTITVPGRYVVAEAPRAEAPAGESEGSAAARAPRTGLGAAKKPD